MQTTIDCQEFLRQHKGQPAPHLSLAKRLVRGIVSDRGMFVQSHLRGRQRWISRADLKLARSKKVAEL